MTNDIHPSATGALLAAREARTIFGLFRLRAARSPEAAAYREFNPGAGSWRAYTWRDIAMRVDRFRGALAAEGLAAGERVAILLANGIDWVCLDLAAQAAGLVPVGFYPQDTAASNAYILGHSDARLMLLDNRERWDALRAHQSEFPQLRRVWIRDSARADSVPSDETSRCLADALAGAPPPPQAHPSRPDDIATIIYTSGTGGRPKGVLLSHAALLANAEAVAAVLPPRPDDVFLSLLPLAHAFERTVGYYLPMMGCAEVAYARSAQTLREDLARVRPTAILAVPRLFEHMSAAIAASIEGNPIKRWLLDLAAAIGWRRFKAAQSGGSPGVIARLLWPMLARNVAAPVLAAFGGRLRVAVSGGAPLDPRIARLIIGLGVPVVEGYGLTEVAPVVAANSLENNVPGTVGPPLPGVSVRIGKDGEVLVRSASMMKGYWKDADETARVIDAEGWLATGDVGEIKDGRLVIRGRLKEMFVLSIGEKINPNILEAAVLRDPMFAQIAVIGNGRPFPVAVIVLARGPWKAYAVAHDLAPDQPNEHAASLLARIEPLLAELPRYAHIRGAHFTPDAWTIENGMLTPTLKVKRESVQAKFAREIEALYAAHRRAAPQGAPL